MDSSVSLEELCRRLKASDRKAFEQLFRLLREGLLRYVRSLIHDDTVAHDLVQDVFVYLWGLRESLDPSRSLKAYLYSMARNRAYRFMRDQRTHAEKHALLKQYAAAPTPGVEEPDAGLDADALTLRLRIWIGELPERQREALLLSRYHALSHREVASVMDSLTPDGQQSHHAGAGASTRAHPDVRTNANGAMKGGNQGSMPPELREQVEHGAPETRRKIERVWRLLGRLDGDTLNVPGPDDAWADLQQRLETPAPAQRPKDRAPDRGRARRSTRRRRLGLSMTGGLAVLLLGVWLWQQPAQVTASRGDQRIVTLPDGSTVHLNSDSRLRYHRGFQTWPFVPAAQRVVALEGEAFFDVVPGTRPFVVETFNARVEVLGTQFDVRARQGPWEGETRVILASGRVHVSALQTPDSTVVLAEAGQVARIGQTTAVPGASSLQQAQMDRLLAWRRQGFSVVDKPLAFILAEVERRFALSVDVEAGIALTDSLSLFYPRGATAEQIIRDICLSQHYRYRQTSSGFVLFPAEP